MAEKIRKKIPIGIEKFDEIRADGFYYIDKTGMIRDLLYNWGKVNLFTRPRRFGKSLNMSMLKCFFEIGCDESLFQGLEIMKEGELCRDYMGKFPVIAISLKSVNGNDYETARNMISSVIGKEALRFQFLADSDLLTEVEKKLYAQLIAVDDNSSFKLSDAVLMGSLSMLSSLLRKHYGREVIVLIDEYDVPLSKAHENGYYDQMVMLIRNMFDQVLKTNDDLKFAVLTGCLRIAKESIFTGLNNMKVLSVTDVRFDEYFGFTDSEVRALLEYYDLSDHYDTIKEWYDGYRFGNVDVYCPWDVLCYCDALRSDPEAQPEAYWSNTSGNEALRHFLEQANAVTKREIEGLVSGESVKKVLRQNLTYKDMYASIDNIWSLLFTTGYLTQRGVTSEREHILIIPNKEIRNIFTEQIFEWFQDTARKDGTSLEAFCIAFKNGDVETAQKKFTEYLRRTISIRDTAVRKSMKENYYHGILLGLLSYKDSWYITSNRESGDGYCDILVETDDGETGMVIEIKYAENGNLTEACERALRQIESKNYAEKLREDGMEKILKYGVACYRKKCRILLEKEQTPQ